jgi:hypothetical protein
MGSTTVGRHADDILGDRTYSETIDDGTTTIRVRGHVDRLGADLLRPPSNGSTDAAMRTSPSRSIRPAVSTPAPKWSSRRREHTSWATTAGCRSRGPRTRTIRPDSTASNHRPTSQATFEGQTHMSTSIDIETQGEHQYVVQLRDGDEMAESWFNITPSILERLRGDGEDEDHFVRRTAEFLVERQGVADFPAIVELEDVIATYSDYVECLSR